MIRPFESVTDLWDEGDVLRRRRYGVIEVRDDRFSHVLLRPVPKVLSFYEPLLLGAHQHRRRRGNRCWLYYNQPRRLPNFLALSYVVSTAGCTLRTFHGALVVLDEIARIKGIDAVVCDVANARISDRLLARGGWEPHLESRWHRHFIKRFYGEYPPPDEALALCGQSRGDIALPSEFPGLPEEPVATEVTEITEDRVSC